MLLLDDAVIGDVEAKLIRTRSPPLNLEGVSNANSKRLQQLRRCLATTPITSTPILSTLARARGSMSWLSFLSRRSSGTLDVQNGRKTPAEALLGGARTAGTAARRLACERRPRRYARTKSSTVMSAALTPVNVSTASPIWTSTLSPLCRIPTSVSKLSALT